MDTAKLHKDKRRPSGETIGVLVLQTGRQAGARRALGAPTTLIGRGQKCDIRLSVDGVDPSHCLLVSGPEGLQLRDLDSAQGTFVNGVRADQATLHDGDILAVGPFQFRLELAPQPAVDDRPTEEMREALRVQAAAVAAQQAALEEEELRLQQRRGDLQQQEEQLAAHLSEKQRQVQHWADHTKAEREALRKEKADQDKQFAKLEKELWQAREELTNERQQLTQARARIDKVYQRLRQRWQRQWAGERQKHQRLADELAAQRETLEQREHDLQKREAAFAEETSRIAAEHALGVGSLREGREALKKEQDSWRRRRSKEYLALKARAHEAEQTRIKIQQLRDLLTNEKLAWEKQHDALHKELLGLNNRIVNQRLRVQEQQEELARLDTAWRQRRAEIAQPIEQGATAGDEAPDAIEIETLMEAPNAPTRRYHDLDRLDGELADQRAHLIEQYQRLGDIHDAWQQQRDSAAVDLEILAKRLMDEEQNLVKREQHVCIAEEQHQERTREIEAVRRELQLWREQLHARDHAFAQQHQKDTLLLRQHQALVEEQLASLAGLRQRWNLRRQKEIECLQAERVILAEEHKETQDRRRVLFEHSRQLDEEKRILAEKALALEQYRQEVFIRAKDPAAQRRVERLRRRWLTLNSTLIRNAKMAADVTKKDMAQLIDLRAELTKAVGRLTHEQAALAEQQTSLEERETSLKIRQEQLELPSSELAGNDIEAIAQEVYQEPDTPAIDQAA
jgi:hypothetical protein